MLPQWESMWTIKLEYSCILQNRSRKEIYYITIITLEGTTIITHKTLCESVYQEKIYNIYSTDHFAQLLSSDWIFMQSKILDWFSVLISLRLNVHTMRLL